MSTLLEFAPTFSHSTIERLGWVLINSLWQFTLVSIFAAVVVRTMRAKSAEARSAVLISLLVLSTAIPIATWMLQTGEPAIAAADARPNRPRTEIPSIVPQPLATPPPHSTERVIEARDSVATEPVLVITTQVEAPSPTLSKRVTRTVRPWLGWMVGVWGLGVVLCSLRPLMGWLTLRRLKRIGVSPASAEVLALLARVSQRLGLQRTVRVLESSLAQVPLVVGYLQPVILLPVILLTNIPATQLEAILAHEIAHIRRHDFVVNLLQVLVETLFFYHPAVWWLSHRIRVEREHCCDDLVVRVMDNPCDYGRALFAVEELRGRSSVLSLGASDGSLLERIRRISGQPNQRTGLSACAAISLLLCMAGIVSFMSLTSNSEVVAMDKNKITDDPLPAGSTLRFGTSRFRHGIPVSSMSLSSDGKMAIVANDNQMQGGTRIFDLVSGRVVSTLGSGIEAAAISPDGLTIVTKQNFSVRVHELTTGKELRRHELPRAKSSYSTNDWVVFTPDGKAVAVTSQGSVIHLINSLSGKMIREFSNENPESSLSSSFSSVLGIAISQDGKLMASGGFANDQGVYFARLWDVESGKELRRFVHGKRSYGIRSLSFSPDSKMLATRSHDGRLRLFSVASGKTRKKFPKDGGGRKAGTVAFSPDGKTVAAAGNSIRLYDTSTGDERLRIDRKQANHLQFTDGGKTLTGAVKGAIYRWDTATGKSLTPEAGDSGVVQILVTPDGSRVITRGQYSEVIIWDGISGKHLHRFHAAWQKDLAMTPDGKFLVWPVADESNAYPDHTNPNSTHDGSRIELYEIAAARTIDRFPGFKGDAGELMFTSDGKQLISAGNQDGVVRMWDFETGKQLRSFLAVPDSEKTQYRQVSKSVLSPDGKTLVVAYPPPDNSIIIDGKRIRRLGGLLQKPGPVRVWDIASGKVKYELKKAYGEMAFSPDGRFFLTSRIIWKTSTGERLGALPESNHIRSLSFSRDGRNLATAVSGDLIRVWDVATWTKRNEFKGHRDGLNTVTFGPGQRLFSGSMDTTVLAWEVSP